MRFVLVAFVVVAAGTGCGGSWEQRFGVLRNCNAGGLEGTSTRLESMKQGNTEAASLEMLLGTDVLWEQADGLITKTDTGMSFHSDNSRFDSRLTVDLALTKGDADVYAGTFTITQDGRAGTCDVVYGAPFEPAPNP